jgi:hypothetical protein
VNSVDSGTGSAGQQAAWDAYVSITVGLLPVLYDDSGTDGWAQVNPRLGGAVVRIRRYAPMWEGDGPMLVAAASSAIRLYRHGDRPALITLAHAMAHRLFLLTIGADPPQDPGRHSRNAGWNRRFEPDTRRPGAPRRRRNTGHHRPRHDEHGVEDD